VAADEPIDAGSEVEVIDREGLKLRVKRVNQEPVMSNG
jgi:membrane-bound ClpP family serine protease